MTAKAIVLLSGGLDSATTLAIAKEMGFKTHTLSFDYGQRHRIELDCATRISEHAGVYNTRLPIDTFAALGGDALTDSEIQVQGQSTEENGLPNTFVPGRNLIFLTFAAAYAYRQGIGHVVTGVAQTDYSGYPDCRDSTMQLLQETLRAGMESDIVIHAPLMHLSKKETVELCERLGCLDAMALTHTCYNGARPPCGECPACELRAKGFAEAGIPDPLLQTQ